MKKATRILAAVFAAVMIVLCLASCDNGGGSEKITVEVWVYKDNNCTEPFVAAKDIKLNAGATALEAVDALCELRGCTYTLGMDNQFSTVTFEDTTIEASDKLLENGDKEMNFLGWKVNDTVMLDINATNIVLPKDKVLADGDKVIIYMMTEVVTPAAD